jgi:predicted AAA+ superfamily ATPase
VSNYLKYLLDTFLVHEVHRFDLKGKEILISNLSQIRDSYEKRVVSLDDISLGNKNGIKHVLAWNLD